ncbi:MAG TPA: MmcQ/YjbR family DNA-binding protein [Myxococcota bacterium]|nr:MmcQ/YjbR family DNA-binding protein [Myxococcota bacterium]HNH45940.1 MmcQ/YjbR family DNA-binding protein [Myxococcota bacterium]
MTTAEADIRSFALSFPNTTEDFPWGESAFKVKGKTFLFMHCSPDKLSMSLKLVASHADAMARPEVKPTGYNLGKSGWVSAGYPTGSELPLELWKSWIEESWMTVAPKRLSAAHRAQKS